MLDISDPEVHSSITNNCKPTKNYDLPETEQSFRFGLKIFYLFVVLNGRLKPFVCLLFYLGSSSLINLYKKQIWNCQQQ